MENNYHSKREQMKENKWQKMGSLVELCFLTENVYIKHSFHIGLCRFAETLFCFIIPLIALMPNPNSFMKKLKNIFEFLCCGVVENLGNHWIYIFGLQLAVACLTLSICIGLLIRSKNEMRKSFIKALSLFYPFCSLILFIQSQTALNLFHKSDIESTKIFGLGFLTIFNDLLIALLCILYNVSFSTCSPITYNHLCTRFNLEIILTSCLAKVLSFVVPFIVSAQIDQQKEDNSYSSFLPLVHISLLTFLLYLKIKSEIIEFTYFSALGTKYHWIALSLEFSILFVIFFVVVSNNHIIVQNSHFLILVLWAFSYFTLQNYKINASYEFGMDGEKSIDSSPKAELFLLHLCQDLLKVDRQSQSLALSNILRKHENQCVDPSCQCKKLSEENRREYELETVISIMDIFRENFPQSEKLLIFTSYLKLRVHQKYVDSFEKIHIFLKNQTGKSFWFEFLSRKFILSIKEYLHEKSIEMDTANIDKCVESEEYLSFVMGRFAEMVNLKTHFWGFFSKGITILKIFQDNINSQLSLMKEFSAIEDHIIEKHENSYILTSLLIAYQRFILMKDKISKEVGDRATLIRNCHKEKTIFKLEKSDKNSVEKSLYSFHSCTIEISMDSQHLGTIISASRNIENVFGYNPNDAKGANINRMLPSSMQEEHSFLLDVWKNKCNWGNIGRYRSVFGVTKENISFSAQIYLKPIVRSEGVNIVGGILKENDKDFMIIDNKGFIVGAGSKYFELLGNVLVGLPLELVCMQSTSINRWALLNQSLKHKSLFYSTRGLESELKQFIQNKNSFSSPESLRMALNEIRKEQLSTCDEVNLEFEVYPYRIGRIVFSVIKIDTILYDTSHKKSMAVSIADVANKVDRISSIKIPEDDEIGFLAGNSSIGSSATSSIQGFDTNISFFEEIFFQKSRVKDQKIITVMNIILLSTIICIIWSCIKLFTNQKGYDELGEIMKGGDEFVSNLQLVMISYNRGLSIMQYLFNIHENVNVGNESEFLQELLLSKYESDVYHNTVAEQIININKQMSSLNKIQLYGHQKSLVNWISNKMEQSEIQVSTFVMNFFYLIHDLKIQASILNKELLDHSDNITFSETEEKYQNIVRNVLTMKINFPTLQSLIFEHIQYFTSEFFKTVETVELLSYLKMAFNCMLCLIILISFRKYYNFRQMQENQIIRQFQQFPMKLVHSLAFYFVNIQYILDGDPRLKGFSEVKLTKDLGIKNVEKMFKEMQFVFEESEIDNIGVSSNTGKSRLNFGKRTSYRLTVFYIALFCITVGCNTAMILTEHEVLISSENVLEHKNKMVISENLLISNYFKFKSLHSANKQERNIHESQLLLSAVNSTSVSFTEAIVNSLSSLNSEDDEYPDRMSAILNENLCQNISARMNERMEEVCKSISPKNILESGLNTVINYFQRTLQLNLHEYIQRVTIDFKEIQMLTNLRIIDQSIIFIFEMLGIVHHEMVVTLAEVVASKAILLNIVLFGELAIFVSFILFIVYFYRSEQRKTAERIGHILLLPVRCLKNNRKMIKNFEHIIDYHHVK